MSGHGKPADEAQGLAADGLNPLLANAGMEPVGAEQALQFSNLLSLVIRWNMRMNLTAIRTEEGILSRHFVESIACARSLPAGISTLLDFGSGAGFPGLPIAVCRPEIAVTLAESQGKKAAFLQEAVRVLSLTAQVHAGRAEALNTVFDCVTLRAVDRMPEAVAAAAPMVADRGWLVVLCSPSLPATMQAALGSKFAWAEPSKLPGSEHRILAMAQRLGS